MKKLIDEYLTWATFNLIISLCWAGAEYYIDGAVVANTVDTLVCMLLGWYMAKDYNRRIRKED